MKTKGQNKGQNKGTGTGAGLSIQACAAFAAWLVRACRRALVAGAVVGTAANSKAAGDWSTAGRFQVAAVRIVSGGAGSFLNAEQAGAVLRFVRESLAVLEFKGTMAAVMGGEDGKRDLATVEAAEAESAHLIAWAAGLGVVVDLGGEAAKGGSRAAALRPVAERGKPCDMARRSARFEDLCAAFEVGHGVGTQSAQARRSRRVSRLAPLSGLACQYFLAPLPVYRLGAAVTQNGAIVAAVQSDKLRPLFDLCAFGEAARIAEIRGRKWTRGTHSSAKGAREKSEIGAAAGADDVADYHIRLETEAMAIFRHAALSHVSRVLSRADRLRVALTWSDLSRIAASKQAGRAGRKVAEAWEYQAVKGRDGREVAGGWALQGAVHGLRDFRLESPTVVDSGAGVESDDMGAAEWSAMLDASAARLGLDLGADVADVEPLSEDMQAAIAEAAEVRQLGGLSWAPDAGAGSGRRPSVMGALQGMVDGVREAVDRRVKQAASNQAAIQARAAGERQIDLVQALREWMTNGKPLPADMVADFWPNGDTSAPLSSSARSKIKRFRDRAGFDLVTGPARAVEPRKPSQVLG